MAIRNPQVPAKLATKVPTSLRVRLQYSRVRLRVLAFSLASTREWRVRLRILASSFASTREFVCEYSRVRLRVLASTRARFASSTLASFDLRVGSAPLACTCARAQMTLACDIACDASHSHSLVKLRLSGTVLCLSNNIGCCDCL